MSTIKYIFEKQMYRLPFAEIGELIWIWDFFGSDALEEKMDSCCLWEKKIKFEKKKEREWKTKLNEICRAINERGEEVAFLRELEPLPPLLTLLKD